MGVNDSHDAAVCILENGKIIFAIQEERLNKIKGYCGSPYLSLDLTLKTTNLAIEDIDVFGFGFQHHPPVYSKNDLLDWHRSSEGGQVILTEFARHTPTFRVYKPYSRHERMKSIRHARNGDKTLVLTLDGGGDGVCTTVSVGDNGRLSWVSTTKEGRSIWNIYANVTFILGMTPLAPCAQIGC